jgi:hypothetical protein
MLDCDLNRLADSYLRDYPTRRDDDFWACRELMKFAAVFLDRAWVSLLLLRKATDNVLGYIAARSTRTFGGWLCDRAFDKAEPACNEAPTASFTARRLKPQI